MMGSMQQDRTVKRAQPNLSRNHFPRVPASLKSLRQTDHLQYERELIQFFQTNTKLYHPLSDIGYWCCYKEQMQDLVTFLSESQSNHPDTWSSFRKEVSNQLSLCRQCAIAYHKAVSAWELGEVSEWSKVVIRKRVTELVEWDAGRLIPLIQQGADYSRLSNDPISVAKRTQCREAFLESLLSLRLCMNEKFCEILSNAFGVGSPPGTVEDIDRFARANGMIPSGLAALCFHSSEQVRKWAKSTYRSCRSHFPADEQAVQLLITKGLRLAFTKASTASESHRSKSAAWAPDLQCLWEGLDTLLTSQSAQELQSIITRTKKCALMESIILSLFAAGRDIGTKSQGLAEVRSSLRYILLRTPFASLFGYGDVTPEKLLDAVFKCLEVRLGDSCDRRLLLDMLCDIASASMRRENGGNSEGLFVKCFCFVEALERFQSTTPSTSCQPNAFNLKNECNSHEDILSTGARLLHKFYWHSWPKLPLNDSKRIAGFVTKLVREMPGREYSWDLLRSVLLTDVFNLLRCVYEPREVNMIATAFFSFHAEGILTPERRFLALEAAVHESGGSEMSLAWVEGLWKNVRAGDHVSEESQREEKVWDFEMSLALDLHRLVGVLDPRRCGDLVKKDAFEPSRALRIGGDAEACTSALVSLRIEFVHDTIISMMQMTSHLSDHCISVRELPFHAAHLLSSSRSEVSKNTILLLQRRCKIQNATYAMPQSRDKVLVHILEQNKDDAGMMFHGFMSATRIKSAQGAAVSVRAYPSFFRWYSLLSSRDCPILQNKEVAKGALGVLLTFFENWKPLELKTSTQTFRETVCRLFSTIPDIWRTLFDTEDNSESKNKRSVDHLREEVSPWARKVAMKLLTMHDLRDDVAFGAWVRLITRDELKPALKSVDPSHGVVMGALKERRIHGRPVNCVQLQQLAKAFDLEETNEIFDTWTLREPGKNSSRTAIPTTVKNLRDTKIDSFFPVRFCRNRSSDLKDGCSAPELKYTPRDDRLQMRMAVAHKGQNGHCSTASVRANRSLHDLRKDHRQARAELRRAATRAETVSVNQEPRKTRFELLREERIAEKERKKSRVQVDESITYPGEIYSDHVRLQGSKEHMGSESAVERSSMPIDLPEDLASKRFSYPSFRRDLDARCIEQIKRDVLMSQNPCNLEAETYASHPPQTFDNVELYVKYWEPFLVAEFRAGMRKKVDEGRFAPEQIERCQENTGGQAVFEVDGPAKDIGYLHTLSITRLQRSCTPLQSHASVGVTPSDMSSVQVSDIVTLEIAGAEGVADAEPKSISKQIFAIVSTVVRSKRGLRLMLQVVFDNAWAPGTGRLLKVSKLLSFATLQRQLDALWSLPKTQDGILWSTLDPMKGWRLKRDLEAYNEDLSDHHSSFPMKVVQRIETLGILNASQGRAITSVIKSCSCLFATKGGGTRSQYAKYNHGSMSLIQGPPGTGKTTTIIALLSALLSCLDSNPYRRKAKVVLDGMPHIMSVPAIRILVCAPSNAAIDELMLRVVNDGLFTTSEYRVCPRLVRVGRGTTVEALQALEVHSLSKSENEESCSKVSTADTSNRDHHKLLEEVNKNIGELEADRRKIASHVDRPSDESSNMHNFSGQDAQILRDIGEKLNILHDKKKLLQSILSREREAERKDEAFRRRENMKRVCNTLATASVVFATLSSSGNEDMKSLGVKFDIIIIDEAGQSCEPESLIPITLGQHLGAPKQRFVHAVLVGDPKQLPATVISSNRRVATAMGQSLFERIGLCDPSIVHVLDTQYRMHPKISQFPSERFYGGCLRNGPNVNMKSMHRVWHFDEQKRFGPLTVFDTARIVAKETRGRGGSLSNEMEAQLVIKGLVSLLRLYGTENLLDDVTVLSPYKQQVLLLQRLVSRNAELLKAKVEVSTIDGIQGREKSVVLLSTVRSGHSKNIGFVKDDKRLNVALTRAKHTLMIFGHAEFLSTHSDTWAALLSHCTKHSQVVTLTDARYASFPESRGVVCPPMRKKRFRVENLSDRDHNEQVIELSVEQQDLKRRNSVCDLKHHEIRKRSSRDTDLRGNRHIEKRSLKEANSYKGQEHHDENERGQEAQRQYPNCHIRLMASKSTVLREAEQLSKRPHMLDEVCNLTELDHKRVLSVPQETWHHNRHEKQKDKEESAHITKLNSSFPAQQPSRHGDLRPTVIKSRARRPQMGASEKTGGYPRVLGKSSISPGCRAQRHGAFIPSGEHPQAGPSSCGVQNPVQIGSEKEPQDRVAKRSVSGCTVGQKRAKVPITPVKRLRSSLGPESFLREEPSRKMSRLNKPRQGNQSTARRQFTLRARFCSEQVADSRVSNGVHQTTPLQTRTQTGRRVITNRQSRNRQSRARQACLQNQSVKYHSRTRTSMPTRAFSLTDTQSKLSGTLDSVRNARNNGRSHR